MMMNRMESRTEPIVVTSAGIIRRLEQFPASTGALDSTALAFEHVLAALARVEARLDASERRTDPALPPPRPDPEPPGEEWQRGRGIARSSRSAMKPPRIEQQLWDRNGAGVEGFWRRRSTAWDNPDHRLDGQPGGLATEWDRYGADYYGFRGRRTTAWDNPTHRLNESDNKWNLDGSLNVSVVISGVADLDESESKA
ncbi:hypothetical protein SASPL_114172 [Salvia splendens]|uniref:Uncharacterized protein n=1 Tax=Salvia splendens TaxID=180675 RepID=A0A8X8Y2W3_SALSN|nr:hypothetical protein SASPL_114172 [Salvia splendens]